MAKVDKTDDIFDDYPPLDLEIDEYRLEDAWLGQPKLMLQWSGFQADAVHKVDIAKAKLELAKAEASREIRDDPEEFGLAKATESTVPAAVLEQPEVIAAQKRYLKAKHVANVLSGVVSAVEDRRRALQKLVDLHGQQYFGAPLEKPAGVKKKRKRKAEGDD